MIVINNEENFRKFFNLHKIVIVFIKLCFLLEIRMVGYHKVKIYRGNSKTYSFNDGLTSVSIR